MAPRLSHDPARPRRMSPLRSRVKLRRSRSAIRIAGHFFAFTHLARIAPEDCERYAHVVSTSSRFSFKFILSTPNTATPRRDLQPPPMGRSMPMSMLSARAARLVPRSSSLLGGRTVLPIFAFSFAAARRIEHTRLKSARLMARGGVQCARSKLRRAVVSLWNFDLKYASIVHGRQLYARRYPRHDRLLAFGMFRDRWRSNLAGSQR